MSQPDPPSTIGSFHVLEMLGQGGMGTVYLAEQHEPVRRKVALKLVRAGLATPAMLARFDAERQALALMSHPNVARMLDAGVTADGVPWFAMEHVPGISITEHCNRERLGLEARLALFIATCKGVHHAHQKGILHRDLKPSNVLVQMQDGAPVPKVIDFGVAKALARPLTDQVLHTEHGQLVGTPEYMSPEQVEMRGNDVDTRSDVYSLGVVLYELLVGALPIERLALLAGGYPEIQRRIREVDPPKPSTRVSTLGASGAASAAQRRTDGARLARALRGDLDWITMKALEKDPTRRYQSASEFAADVERFLKLEPVLAGPPSFTYRLRKHARRHRVAWTAGAIVLAVAVAGFVATWRQYQNAVYAGERARVGETSARDAQAKAEEQRRLAAEASARAESNARKQAVTGTFLAETLASADPYRALGPNTTIRAAMIEAQRRLDTGALRDDPETQAMLQQTIGRTFQSIGSATEAQALLRASVEGFRVALGDRHPDVAGAMVDLADALLQVGKGGEAESVAREALGILEESKPTDDLQIADAELAIANALADRGKLDEAEARIRAAQELYEASGEKGTNGKLVCLGQLAMIFDARGRPAEALEALEQALIRMKEVFGPEHPRVAVELNNVCVMQVRLGRFEDACVTGAQALAIFDRSLPETDPSRLRLLVNLATALGNSGRFAEAEERYRWLIDHVDDDLSRVALQNNLANLLLVQKDPAGARPLLRAVVATARASELAAGPELARFLTNLAMAERGVGDDEEAEKLLREALALRRERLAADHPDRLTSLEHLATLLFDHARYAEAEALWREAIELVESAVKLPRERRKSPFERLARTYEAWGKPEDARRTRERGQRIP